MKKHSRGNITKTTAAVFAIFMGTSYVMNANMIVPTHAADTNNEKSPILVDKSTTWRYLDNNVDPGTQADRYAWTKADYAIESWKSGVGSFGAKKGEIADLGGGCIPTVLLNQYIDESNKNVIPTYFFRTTFTIDDLTDISTISGSLTYDDAAIIYINGQKVTSFYEPEGGFESNMSYGGSNKSDPLVGEFQISKEDLATYIKTGENTLAVELHNGRETSSDIYFGFENLQINYEKVEVTQKSLNLTVGSDETEMNATWYADSAVAGSLQFAEAGAMINGEFPQINTTLLAKQNVSNDTGYYYNRVTLTGLKENTKYVYRILNDETISENYYFTTKNFDGSYNFVFAGDPQIGASGNSENDAAGWNNTLELSAKQFNPSFVLSAGDQVESASNESQYSGFLSPDETKSIPQALNVGNHDSGSTSYSQHYNLPNTSEKGQTTAGGDYWYVYNNTLFMSINTNNSSTAEHKAFMEEALALNANARWKVVNFHHSIYSVASHAVETSILNLRNNLVPVFDELEIDVVLMGHDHVYVRSHMMKGLEIAENTTDKSSVTDPDGILYLTANSASGSKFYNIKSEINMDFVSVKDQSKLPTISNVEVTDNEFKVTTYLLNSAENTWTKLDEFAIEKSAETNEEAITLTPTTTTSIATTLNAPANAIEKGAVLEANMIKDGSVYDTVKATLAKQTFEMINLGLKKNDIASQPLSEVQVSFKIPATYSLENLKIYRTPSNLTKAAVTELVEIPFTLQEDIATITTTELGSFVIADTTKINDDNTGDDVNPDDGTTDDEGATDDGTTDDGKDDVNNGGNENNDDKDDGITSDNNNTTTPSTNNSSTAKTDAIKATGAQRSGQSAPLLLFSIVGCASIILGKQKQSKQ